MQLTNACTDRRELFVGHLACVFLWGSLFWWVCQGNCVQIYGPHLVFLGWLFFQIDPKQNPSADIYSQFMIFILPAGICPGMIYYFSEAQ